MDLMDSALEEANLHDTIYELGKIRLNNDKDLTTALAELSNLPNQESLSLNAIERKTHCPDLGTMIENHRISYYVEFLESFKEVKDKVNTLHGELKQLNGFCESMEKNLWLSKQNSRNLIDEIAKLEIERKKLEKERDLAQAYQNAFQLNAEDIKVLRATDNTTVVGEISPEFFTVFEKIQKIQANVNILLKAGHQTTAVDIMDQMSLFQESALEKIYRWAQSHCKNVENPEISLVLNKSLSYLQIRPMLLKYVLDEYCAHRRSLLVRNFIDALTGVGNIKGIELVGSTDPSKYISDMLEWIHQSVPTEKANLMILLKSCDKIDLEEKIATSLSTILDGVCRPLLVRMEQTILSGLDSTLMNRIDLKISFYGDSIEKIVPGSNLNATLRELQMLCHCTFINQLKAQVAVELEEYRAPGPDLVPSSCINILLDHLRGLLKEEWSSETSADQMKTLLNMIIVPLIDQINNISNRLVSPDNGIYLSNCLSQIINFLEENNYPNVETLHSSLKGQIDVQVDRLSSEQSSWLIAQLGIGHIYTILHEKIDDPLCSVPGMDASSLKIFFNKLDTLIANPESALLAQLIHISDRKIKRQILKQSFKILVAIYKQVYEAVQNPKNQYPKDILIFDPTKLEKELDDACSTKI